MNPNQPLAHIDNLDYEGRGIARIDGKTVFIQGAMPQETVQFQIVKQHKGFDEAIATKIIHASPFRRTPPCPHFGVCGGCALQHINDDVQTALKQRIAEEQLQRIAQVRPSHFLPAIHGIAWHYRQRARLSVASEKGSCRIGFQAKKSHQIINIDSCLTLSPALNRALPVLQKYLKSIAHALKLRYIELADGKDLSVALLAMNHTPTPHQQRILHDLHKALQQTGKAWRIDLQIGKQPAFALQEMAKILSYELPEFDIIMPYQPSDFTQVNAQTNALMVSRAMRLLEPQHHENIADLFCGLGNFTLPLAKSGAKVLAIEGLPSLIERAKHNAQRNRLHNIDFRVGDLFDTTPETVASWGKLDKMLLDPPRAGAYALVQALHAPFLPKRIVYVSCNPATFARDAAVLVGKGYRFTASGVMNLFPQTAHIENIAVFDLA
ncbi:MAG: 23S rRNA (uracil(1939)-C(5))-methyltransferase RlmD [Neisseria sp.]|nr:23S rRNA (uracil(1939)-C(5))-methyltransferase RlmD [Neisseria sp.]